MSEFWQAPGSSEIFNTAIMDWSVDLEKDTSRRAIAVLKFINDNPDIKVSEFKKKFLNFFIEFRENPDLFNEITLNNGGNASTHFFKVLLFIGFIEVTNQESLTSTKSSDKLNITNSGQLFLNELKNENFDNALNIFLECLFETKFPNKATYKVRLRLYPFLIMFKLLSERSNHNGIILRKMFITDIPFIKSKQDIDDCLEKLNDDCYLSFLDDISLKDISKLGYGENHKKWNMWVVSSLIDLGILEEHDGYIILSDYKKRLIQDKVDDISYESCFL